MTGLRVAKAFGINKIEVFIDSQLIARQIQGEYVSKEPRIATYAIATKVVLDKWSEAIITLVNNKDSSKIMFDKRMMDPK